MYLPSIMAVSSLGNKQLVESDPGWCSHEPLSPAGHHSTD